MSLCLANQKVHALVFAKASGVQRSRHCLSDASHECIKDVVVYERIYNPLRLIWECLSLFDRLRRPVGLPGSPWIGCPLAESKSLLDDDQKSLSIAVEARTIHYSNDLLTLLLLTYILFECTVFIQDH